MLFPVLFGKMLSLFQCNTTEITVGCMSFQMLKTFSVSVTIADYLMLNHLIILAKQHILCSFLEYLPLKVAFTYYIETIIADSNGKRSFHDDNSNKYVQNNRIMTLFCSMAPELR